MTAVLVVAAWLVLSDERIESGGDARRGCATGGGRRRRSRSCCRASRATASRTSTRWRDGLIFGALVVAGGCRRGRARTRTAPARHAGAPACARTCAGAVAVVAVVVGGRRRRRFVHELEPGRERLRPATRAAGSNFRWEWWQQAWHGLGRAPARRRRAPGRSTSRTFATAARSSTRRPSRTACRCSSCRRPASSGSCCCSSPSSRSCVRAWRRRGHELALALFLPAFLLHSLIDVDWDFVAVSAPALRRRGCARGPSARPGACRCPGCSPRRVRRSSRSRVLLLPWLGARWSDDALAASPARAVQLADRADSVDPLLVDPLWAKAFAAETLGEPQRAFDYYVAGRRSRAEEPADVAARRRVRVLTALLPQRVHLSREVHGARSARSAGRGRGRLPRGAAAGRTAATAAARASGAEQDGQLGAVQRRRLQAVERPDDLDVQVVGET